MRNLKRNKQTLYYSLYKGTEPIYRLDENGDKVVVYTDNSTTPPTKYYDEIGTKDSYEKPVEFEGNIALSGGESQAVDFGVSVADYSAILITEVNSIPITETSLIWHNTKPIVGVDGYPDPASADYKVVKLSPSLNEGRYVLSKVVK